MYRPPSRSVKDKEFKRHGDKDRDRGDRDRGDRDRGDRDKRFAGKRLAKFSLPKGTKIDYKEVNLLQKYVTERGKILSRRVTGVSAKEQREIARAIRQARYLGLIYILGTKRK